MIIFFKEMVFLSALSNPGWEVWVPATVSALQKPPLPLSTFILVSCLGNLAMSLAVDYHPLGGRVIFMPQKVRSGTEALGLSADFTINLFIFKERYA